MSMLLIDILLDILSLFSGSYVLKAGAGTCNYVCQREMKNKILLGNEQFENNNKNI